MDKYAHFKNLTLPANVVKIYCIEMVLTWPSVKKYGYRTMTVPIQIYIERSVYLVSNILYQYTSSSSIYINSVSKTAVAISNNYFSQILQQLFHTKISKFSQL